MEKTEEKRIGVTAVAGTNDARVTPSPTLEGATAASLESGTDGRKAAATNQDSTFVPIRDSGEEKEEEEPQELTAQQEEALVRNGKATDFSQLDLDRMFEKLTEHKFDNIPPFVMPKGFRDGVQLFPFQQDGIRFLLNQETATDRVAPFWKCVTLGTLSRNEWWKCSLTNKHVKEMPVSPSSSILADDMGTGKTIQSLGLMLSNMPQKGTEARCTLIVAPVSVLANWRIQIGQFVEPGVLTVEVYRGPDREATLRKVKRGGINVLLVSYETLVIDFKLYEEIMDEQEEEEELQQAQNQSNKKVKRSEVVDAWKRSGTSSDSDDDFEMDSDYSSEDDDHYLPSSMTRKTQRKQPNTWIFDIPLWRVILDEAHGIRNSETGRFKSVMALIATNKLALTGTPYVNRPNDLHSLFAFLGADPLADAGVFDSCITKPIENCREIGLSRVRTMMGHLALRRTKAVVKSTIQLPPKEVVVRLVDFPEEGFHSNVHSVLYKTVRSAYVSMHVKKGGKGNMLRFLALVTRVRQACCHGGLVPQETMQRAQEILRELEEADMVDEGFDIDSTEGKALLNKILFCLSGENEEETIDSSCAVCFEELDEETACVLRTCKHVFCSDCLGTIETRGSSNCPICREPYRKQDMIKKSVAEAAAKKVAKSKKKAKTKAKKEQIKGNDEMHPKEVAVLDELSKMKPDEKAVIFSQWTSVLSLLEKLLDSNDYTTTRIDGTMDTDERLDAIESFSSDEEDSPRVILCSSMACGTGINLTRGNLAIIIEPWWNFAVEAQCMDRIHRIGQKRPVKAVRLIMANSIEERMLVKVQDGKTALGKGSLQKLSKQDREKARITALKDLFEVDDGGVKWEGEYDDDDDEDLDGFIVDDNMNE